MLPIRRYFLLALVFFSSDGKAEPLYLVNGVQKTCTSSESYTLVQPVGTRWRAFERDVFFFSHFSFRASPLSSPTSTFLALLFSIPSHSQHSNIHSYNPPAEPFQSYVLDNSVRLAASLYGDDETVRVLLCLALCVV